MPATNPAVSIIVPCRNEAKSIEGCIKSILAQEQPEGGVEIIVAEGMSSDGTREILRNIALRESRVRVVNNRRTTVSAGLNKAIRAAKGGVIVRMDAHTEYAPDYTVRCIEQLHKTAADNVGGPARTAPTTYIQQAVAAVYHSSFSVGGARFHNVDYEGPVDTVTYGCWMRSAFERFGYFDEGLARNQDDEHNLRILRSGGRIWQSPGIKSWYQPRGSLSALFKQYMQYGYWKVRVIQKHKIPASWRHLVPGAFVLAVLSLLLVSTFSQLLWEFIAESQSALRPVVLFSVQLSTLSLMAVLSLYLIAVLIASILTAAKSEWKLLPVLPFVFPCYHLGYGYGFLRGLWDFVISRRGPREAFGHLTR